MILEEYLKSLTQERRDAICLAAVERLIETDEAVYWDWDDDGPASLHWSSCGDEIGSD